MAMPSTSTAAAAMFGDSATEHLLLTGEMKLYDVVVKDLA
jgi:hypothetical protein